MSSIRQLVVHVLLCILAEPALLRHTGLNEKMSLVAAPSFKHVLRVCNVYADVAPIHVFLGENMQLTSNEPMTYKSCREFQVPLADGDVLTVEVANGAAGSFAISDLPQSDAILLFVVQHHDTLSTAVSFKTHVFSLWHNAQIATINAFKGPNNNSLQIADLMQVPSRRIEKLQYDRVVAVSSGRYEIELVDRDGATLKTSDIVALSTESYVVILSGINMVEGEYPQDITVFPNSDIEALKSKACAASTPFFCLLAIAFAACRT